MEQIPEEPDEQDFQPEPDDHESAHDDQTEGDNEQDVPDLSEVAEVLTVTAKKLSGLRLGRKFTGGPRKDTAALKKETHCQACGEKGHWKGDAECPMTPKTASSSSRPAQPAPTTGKGQHGKGGKTAHQTFFVRDMGSFEATDDPEYGSLFQVNVVFKVQAEPGTTADFSEVMVLDTACQRTVCGLHWEKSHDHQLQKRGLNAHRVPCTDSFQFGSGDPLKAARRSYLPVGLGHHNLIFGVGVVSAKIPLLASNRLLDQLGMILDLPRNLVHFEGLHVTVPLLRIGGHLAVCITDFSEHVSWQQLQNTVNWDHPPAELVAQDLAEPTLEPQPAHGTSDHPSAPASWMASLLETPGGEPGPLSETGVPQHDCRGEPRHPPGRDLRGDSPAAGRSLQPSTGQLRPSRLCPVRERLREVRPMQEVPPEAALERAQRSMGRSPKGGIRHYTSHLATAFALLFQYIVGGSTIEQPSVPAFVPGFPHRRHGEDFTQEALGEAGFSEQRLGDGRGPLEAAAGRGLGDLRLERGRVKRLKGSWSRSAKVLDSEREIYDAAPRDSQPAATHRGLPCGLPRLL